MDESFFGYTESANCPISDGCTYHENPDNLYPPKNHPPFLSKPIYFFKHLMDCRIRKWIIEEFPTSIKCIMDQAFLYANFSKNVIEINRMEGWMSNSKKNLNKAFTGKSSASCRYSVGLTGSAKEKYLPAIRP